MSNKKKKKRKIVDKSININHPLFHFIRALDNDCFTNMSGLDLQELLYYMDSYYLSLRSKLNLTNQITFGLEIEAEKANRDVIENDIEEVLSNQWIVKGDCSLNYGVEINSPILEDKKDTWSQLKKVCLITSQSATIGENSGGHIHIGSHVLGEKVESWMNFMKLFCVYENILYRFTYGEFLDARFSIEKYAQPIAKKLWFVYQKCRESSQLNLEDLLGAINLGRYQSVNFYHVKYPNNREKNNTIEFRCPNGTLDPTIWQNNVNLLANMLLYSNDTRYDDDKIEKRRLMNKDNYSDLDLYGEVYLQQALELCDMLFTNNVDKIYFLKQYLKSFQIGNKSLERAKTFTKSISN